MSLIANKIPRYSSIPHELCSLINEYLELEDLIVLMDVSKADRQAVVKSAFADTVWNVFQKKFGYNIQKQGKILLASTVMGHIFNQAKKIIKAHPKTITPNIITEILKTDKQKYRNHKTLLKATNTLLKWFKAIDLLSVRRYYLLYTTEKAPQDLTINPSLKEMLKNANEFNQWAQTDATAQKTLKELYEGVGQLTSKFNENVSAKN